MPGSVRHSPFLDTASVALVADDDAVLVARAQRDRRAFTPLYERYFDAIHRYCYHRLGSWEEAEDATSLIFTNALAALPRFRSEGGTFRSWLFAIAHNAIGNRYRVHRPEQGLAAAATLAAPGPTPEEVAFAGEEATRLHALLAQLPDEQRRLLELRLAGLNDAEIARVVGMSHGAVRVAQHRAIVRLRSLLTTAESGQENDHVAR